MFQYGKLNDNCNPHKPIIAVLEKYKLLRVLEGYFKGLLNPKDKEQDKDKEKDKENRLSYNKTSYNKFNRPTLEEVTAYIKEKKYNVDADKWYNFYQSKGWMIGKNKMKDWKAAVRTWVKNTPEDASEARYKRLLNMLEDKEDDKNAKK